MSECLHCGKGDRPIYVNEDIGRLHERCIWPYIESRQSTIREQKAEIAWLLAELRKRDGEIERLREAAEALVDVSLQLARGKPVRNFDEAILCVERALCLPEKEK